jgi:transposase InsO family protein
MPHSIVHKILVRLQINKLAPPEELPPPGPRYEHAHPGGLLHVDVKKLHRIGLHKRPAGPGECLHVVLDDHSRAVYQEVHPDESALTAAAVLERSVAWFASLGVTCQRVLTDNHPTYRSLIWRHTCQLLQMRAMRTRPRRPQTNGKVERWNRTLLNEALRRRTFVSTQAREIAIDNFVNAYNAHRPHTALDGKAPLQRLFKV